MLLKQLKPLIGAIVKTLIPIVKKSAKEYAKYYVEQEMKKINKAR